MSTTTNMIRALWEKSVVRYLAIAIVGVGLELAIFALLNNVLRVSYAIATPVSTALVIIYNWHASRKVVFKNRHHSPHKEFVLVLIVSVVGIGIQTLVTILSVEKLHVLPILGKMIAICVTFFWNYWFRRQFIYPVVPARTETIVTKLAEIPKD